MICCVWEWSDKTVTGGGCFMAVFPEIPNSHHLSLSLTFVSHILFPSTPDRNDNDAKRISSNSIMR